MSVYTQPVATFTALTVSGLSTLANVTYVASADIDLTSGPIDLQIQVEVTPGAVSGNKRLVIFAQASTDGASYQTGPTSGTTVTDEPVLTPVGVLPLPSNSTLQRKVFNLVNSFPTLPPHCRLVFFNDCGTAFTAETVKVGLVSGLGV